ncbi:hypothetical protein BKA56DRAFT_340917 [Ilyonectria sp. MPI-CAGE-AT-0026]|nr:hypothetical protein BKA56DRAFT_340917 [Ilyonectria sp. MPI-CAGE-AT-0026]
MPLSELPKSGKELGPAGRRFSNSHPAVLESSANPKLPTSHVARPPWAENFSPSVWRWRSRAYCLQLKAIPISAPLEAQTPPLSPLSAEHLKPEVRTSSVVLWMHRRWVSSWLLGCWCGSSKVVRVLLTAYFTVRNLIDRTCPMGDPVGMAEPATVPSELCLFTSLMPGDGTMPRAQWLGNPVEIACFQPIHHSSCSSRC